VKAPALVVVTALALLLTPPLRAASAQPGPSLQVPEGKLASALSCPDRFSGAHEPVLLIHGTTYTPKTAWGWNYAKTLPGMGYDVCTVELPNLARDDIQVSTEYVVYAIRTIAQRSRSKVDVLSYSQGPMEARWALKWWPDTPTLVDDEIMMAAPNHGFRPGDVVCQPSCIPPFWQMKVGSHFIGALNQGDETPGEVSYTSIFSRTDQFVQPAVGGGATAALDGAANVAVQDLCPGRYVEHIGVVPDAVFFAVAMDALARPGPADPGRIDRAVCTQDLMPGVSRHDADADRAQFYENAPSKLGHEHHSDAEPPLAAYATS
jgi:triacylglycerol lipase